MPKVSIIVPVYKVEAYLHKCIESILAQTLADFELILVNDGSPDNCPAICNEYAKQDTRIQVIHKENGGLTSARLAGFRHAQGDYISFVDSDDYLERHMIEKLYKACIHDGSDMSICSYYTVANNQIIPYRLPIDNMEIPKDQITEYFILPAIGKIFTNNHVNVPGFLWLRMFKTNILNENCFVSEREFFTEDDLLNLIVAPQVQQISVVNEPLYYYCQNTQSLTNRYRANAWELLLNRYHFCVDYCHKNNLIEMARSRLDFGLFGSVCYCIENASKINDMNSGLSEIKQIVNHHESREMLDRINVNLMTKTQKMIYYMCKFKMLGLLYLYRRMRVRMISYA